MLLAVAASVGGCVCDVINNALPSRVLVVVVSTSGYVGSVVKTTLSDKVLAVAASVGDVHGVGDSVETISCLTGCWLSLPLLVVSAV